ncbi:hypothetical protein AALO_G00255070 [Alosa alosa]|uniref:Uncharacterized protein n=1 Tax=Alosa alosa TaxID=278164 RepID=A0AAV6FRZ4_9TELE|nr:hypothetical protein AALO_G00255070 [Alosa alosa]
MGQQNAHQCPVPWRKKYLKLQPVFSFQSLIREGTSIHWCKRREHLCHRRFSRKRPNRWSRRFWRRVKWERK